MSNVGQANPFSDAGEYNALDFVIARATEKMQTVSIVSVKAVNTGAQTVDVLVLVNLVTGANVAVPHGIISARPYWRLQGGSSGIICDPVVGDIGVMVFASRDSSAVIANKGVANPGSARKFAWSDGIYLDGILNTTPTQYIKFLPSGGGITLYSAGTITCNTPLVHDTGNLQVDGDVNISGGTTATSIDATSAIFSGTVNAGVLQAGNGFTGTFATGDSRTVTVVDGIITGVA